MKIYFTILFNALCILSFGQGWVGDGGNILNTVNSGLNLTPIYVGIGTSAPSAQFHTTGTVRFAGITNNNTYTRVLVQDANGNLFWRDVSTIGTNNAWLLLGNGGTNPTVNFLGTTDNNRLVFRTNNTEKMTILANGNVGIGTSAPKTLLHVLTGGTGAMAFPYESGVIERNSDAKFGVYCANTNPLNTSASSIALGYTATTDASGNYLGYEMQYGSWTAGNFLRFNALVRNAAGTVLTGGTDPSYQNVLILNNNGKIGINLTSGANAPVTPTANLHVKGTVRFETLPNATGTNDYLVIDATGNVFRSSNTVVGIAASNNNSEDLIELKNEVAILKDQVQELIKIMNNKGCTVPENAKKGFLIYPNPSSGVINISSLSGTSLPNKKVVFQNIAGKTINTFSIDNFLSIPATNLPSGTYVIDVYQDNSLLQSEKVIINK